MEYTGIIHMLNSIQMLNDTYSSYVPNITPITYIEPYASIIPYYTLKPITYIKHFDMLATLTMLTRMASLTYLKAILYIQHLASSFASFASFAYIEHMKEFLYLLPLAFLALFTFITLLLTYNKDVIEDDLTDDEILTEEDYITDDELIDDEIDYTLSSIEECKVVNKEGVLVSDNKKFRGILVDIWKTMEKQEILENTTFKFKSGNKRGVKGYNWFEEINMSFQNRDANATLKEIIYFVKINNYAIDLSITLRTGETVKINID
uniref:Uncharacterized protein n=1 Tax=viral metagenome TaxID=1070528 RepID=A0A6C0LNW5_9ZZZZ